MSEQQATGPNPEQQKIAAHLAGRRVKHPWHAATNWKMVQHRIEFSKENQKPCKCPECEVYMAALEKLRVEGEIR